MSETPVAASWREDFLVLYDRALTDVYSYLLSRVRDRALAEDLTQEAFLAGARRAASGEACDVAWLIAVARNKLIDHWRAQERHQRRLRLLPGREAEGELATRADALDEGRVADALAELNPRYRAALVLRHVDGLTVADVARHLDRSVAATEQILSRARAAFRAAYEGTER